MMNNDKEEIGRAMIASREERWQPLCLKLSLKLIVVRFGLHAVLHVVDFRNY